MSKRGHAIDPANTCTECGHLVYGLPSGTGFCPCEDCHIGGLVQGREPRPATGTNLRVEAESVTAWTGLDDHDAMVRKGLAEDLDGDDVESGDWLHSL